MTQLTQFVITGLAVGMVYALIALGFAIIWKSSSVANLALGQIVPSVPGLPIVCLPRPPALMVGLSGRYHLCSGSWLGD
jgi:hypothetical protein